MHLSSVPKKGRSNRGTSKRANVMVPGHEAASGTHMPSVTSRLCQEIEHSQALSKTCPSDWTNTRRTRQNNSLQKISADTKFPDNTLSDRVAEKGKISALPLIRKGAGKVTAISAQNTGRNTDHSLLLKTSQSRGKQKPQPILACDVTPWVKASPSETSLTCLLHSIPSPKMLPDNMSDCLQSQRDIARKDNWNQNESPPEQPQTKDKANGKAKLRGRTGVTKRRTFNKFHNMKLPPVPAVTELNFSRNFSFSFFELPQHQSPQHWLQRQKYVCMMMRQLQ